MQLLLCKDNSLKYDFSHILENKIIEIELQSGESPTGILRVGDIVNYKYYALNEKYGCHDVSVYQGQQHTIDQGDEYIGKQHGCQLPGYSASW